MPKLSFKTFFRHPTTQKTIAWFLAKYMLFVYKTSSWQYVYKDRIEYYWKNKKPIIVCFWHNRLGMLTFAWQNESPFYMLISRHADGILIAKTVEFHGVHIIEGSTSKGTSSAVRQILKTLKEGHTVGVTPDGPRGPRYSINPGLISIARKAGVDLVPASYSITRRKVLSSWDRLVLPLPFSKGVFIVGDPIITDHLSTEEDYLKAAHLLRENLIKISDEADVLCGQETIPAPELEHKKALQNAL